MIPCQPATMAKSIGALPRKWNASLRFSTIWQKRIIASESNLATGLMCSRRVAKTSFAGMSAWNHRRQ